jgi:hypothetical protein
MGTRALISIDGKPMIATHWDGNPENLGVQLSVVKPTIENIIEVAKKHTIDSANRSILRELNNERIRMLMEKHKLTREKIIKGFRRGNIIGAEDYDIGDIKNYGDFAEYQYDIDSKTGKIKFRELHGSWNNAKAGKWTNMNEKWKAKQLAKIL